MLAGYICRHFQTGDNVIFERKITLRKRNASKDPEEVFTKVRFRFFPDATRSIAWHICFYLNINKLGASDISTENISIGRITKGNDCIIPSTA